MDGLTQESISSISEEKFAWAYDMDQCSTSSSPIPTQEIRGFRPINITKPFNTRELSRSSPPLVVDLTNDLTDDSDVDGDDNGHDDAIEEDSDIGVPSVTGNPLIELLLKDESSPMRRHTDSPVVTNTSILDNTQPEAYIEDTRELREMLANICQRLLFLEQYGCGAASRHSNRPSTQPRAPKRIKRAGRKGPKPYSITDIHNQEIDLSIQAERIIIRRGPNMVEYTWEHPRRRGGRSSERKWKALLPEGRELAAGKTLLARMDVIICVRVKQEWPPIRLSWNHKAELYEGEAIEGKRLCVQRKVMSALVSDVDGAHLGFLVDETDLEIGE